MQLLVRTLAGFLATVFAWILLISGAIPLPDKFREEVVPVLPYWALVTFGVYALGTLGYDVLTFNDKPEKYRELMAQIKEARADLTAKGIQL